MTHTEQHQALVRYAQANGRNWKAKLLADWQSGRNWHGGNENDAALLRQLRNNVGPSGLAKLRVVGDSVLADLKARNKYTG